MPRAAAAAALAPVGDSGREVDWWFVYKAPAGCGDGAGRTDGTEYAYADSAGGGQLRRSAHRLPTEGGGGSGALLLTLRRLGLHSGGGAGRGWVLYNDDLPDAEGRPNNATRGHCKGIVAWDPAAGAAWWLVHSVPNFPARGECGLPKEGLRYGQSMLCVALSGVAEAARVAAVLRRHHEPQTYACSVPAGSAPELAALAGNSPDRQPDAPADVPIRTRAGASLRLLAKDRHWGRNFWADLVAPSLSVSLRVETWRRGELPPEEAGDGRHRVRDVGRVDLAPLGWAVAWAGTRDHAKLGIGEGRSDWVCVGDINRMTTQQRRGGGALCFRCAPLRKDLAAALLLAPAAPEPAPPSPPGPPPPGVYPPLPPGPSPDGANGKDRPVCPQCGKSFASKQTLKRHMESRTACKGQTPPPAQPPFPSPAGPGPAPVYPPLPVHPPAPPPRPPPPPPAQPSASQPLLPPPKSDSGACSCCVMM